MRIKLLIIDKMKKFILIAMMLHICAYVSSQRAALSDYKAVKAKDGRMWLDRNLGAERVANSSDDSLSYGDLYQWNRSNDGHQKRNSEVSDKGPVSEPSEAGSFFYTAEIFFYVWTFPLITQPVGKEKNVWSADANPCPRGFRVPTADEWQNLLNQEGIINASSAFSSTLKLPAAGFRDSNNGKLFSLGKAGSYWSSSLQGSLRTYYLKFSSHGANIIDHSKCSGFSIRCIAE